jgi:hypothetical protein
MFAVDDDTAGAIRRVYEESGELAAVVELRRHFPLFENSEHARSCVRSIASWTPIPERKLEKPSPGRRLTKR